MSEYLERFAHQQIKVDGQVIEVAILGPSAEVAIGPDLSSEMDRVSAQMAYWGAVLADAKQEQIRVDSWYRNFRANMSEAILERDPKLSEWKVKTKVEASQGFLQQKEAISIAEKNVSLCEAMFRAFEKKANALQSRGAKERSEIGSQGMTTPMEPRGWNLSGEGSKHDDDGELSNVKMATDEQKLDKLARANRKRKGKGRA